MIERDPWIVAAAQRVLRRLGFSRRQRRRLLAQVYDAIEEEFDAMVEQCPEVVPHNIDFSDN